MEFKHKSVLLEETIENLNIKPDGIYVVERLAEADIHMRLLKDSLPEEDL